MEEHGGVYPAIVVDTTSSSRLRRNDDNKDPGVTPS
jgi:hypothetical protein